MAEQVQINIQEVVRAGVAEATGHAPAANTAEANIIQGVQRSYTEQNHPLHAVAGVETPTAGNAKAIIEANTGTTFDAAGNKIRDLREANLKTRADQVADNLTDIINGRNVDTLADNVDVQGWVESIILQNPEQAAQYNALGVADQKSLRISYLTDRVTIDEASKLLKDRAGIDKIITDKTEQYRKEAADLQEQRKKLDERRQEIEKEVKDLHDEAKEYTTYKPAGGAIHEGDFVNELKTLEQDAAPLRGEVAILERQVSEIEQTTSRLESISATAVGMNDQTSQDAVSRRTNIQLELARVKDEQTPKVKELGDKRKTLSEKETRIKAINDRKAEITSQINTLNKEHSEIITKLADVDPKLAKALNDFHQEQLKRITAEGKFVTSLERILPEAFAKAYNTRMDALVKSDIAVETKKAADAKTTMEAGIRTALARAYRNANGEIDWDSVRQRAWPAFLRSGVDGIIQGNGGLLIGLLAGPPAVTLDQLKADNELYKSISDDIKKKMTTLRVAMPRESAFLNFLRGPQPLSRQESIDIIDQLGEDYLQGLVARNQSIRTALKSVGEEGMLTSGTKIGENLKKRSLGSLLLLLPLLLSGGFLFGKGRQ